MDGGLWYFAYGSNLCPDTFLGRRGMQPRAARAACLDGFRLVFNLPIGPGERGVANVEPCTGAATCGVAYLLAVDDCARLDRTEGVHAGIYERLPVTLRAADATLDAFTYRSTRVSAGRKPSARYMGLILAGARHHGLPDDWIRFLAAHPLAIDERLAGA